jgi:hypothetical protein
MGRKRIVRCLVQGCGKEANGARGLCMACYAAAYREVQAERTTWEALQRRKLAGPDGRKHMAPRTAIGRILAGASK